VPIGLKVKDKVHTVAPLDLEEAPMHALVIVGLAVWLWWAVPPAAAVDLHHFWDQRCGGCHGHAGEFARRYLKVESGKLVGRHHTDNLRLFLGQHEMSGAIADEIYAMLLAQASTAPVYQEKCRSCHQNAAELARSSLVANGATVVGRQSGRPLADFLPSHARLTAGELSVLVESLTRVYREVHGP
jgi:hypothetical protein